MAHTRRGSKSRIGAFALASIFVLAQIAETWHLTHRQHVRCAEHGEWVDVAAWSTGTEVAASESAVQSHRGPEVLPGAPTSGEHEHCVMMSTRRASWTTPVTERVALRAPIDLVREASSPEVPELASFALYLLAPKHSPPA